MDILELNKLAWDNIGKGLASPYMKSEKYLEMLDMFCERMPKKAKILDMGCGTGLPITRELVRRGFCVTGLDISDTMIRLAKKNVPDARYVRKSITDMDFSNEFDGAVSSFVMLHLDVRNFRTAASKISESLKPGGYLFLALNEGRQSEEENFIELMGQRMYSRPYSEEEIRDIFGRNSMIIVKTERETVISKTCGEEHTLLLLLQKTAE